MGKLSLEKIVKNCLYGIRQSFNDYYEWSAGEWLSNAPEYLLTINIAKEIAKNKENKFLTLEDNVRNTLEVANTQIRGKLSKNIRENGRTDIIIWWAKGTPRGIIEVKNDVWGVAKIQGDVKRIINILQKKSDIEFGIITFFIKKSYKNNLIQNTEKFITENIFNNIEIPNNLKKTLQMEYLSEKDNLAAYSVIILFKKNHK